MNTITDIMNTIGIPCIVGAIIWLIRLESQVKQNRNDIDTLKIGIKESENKLEQQIDRLTQCINKLSEQINALNTNIIKHELALENLKNDVKMLKDDILNRPPCIAHDDNRRSR